MNMKKAYERSIQIIKKEKISNLKDYTKIAKEKNLLNAVSLEYISRREFNNLLRDILKGAYPNG